MDSQNLILLAIGIFLALIITVTAVDQFLLDEHPPLQVEGLIWRVENAFSHIRDLESVLEITEGGESPKSMRMLVRYLAGPPSALSVRYLDPDPVEGEIFTVQNDVLSHYMPQENVVVIKRWVGLPLAAIGLGGFDVGQLRTEWNSGHVRVQVLQNVAGFTTDLIPSPIDLKDAFSIPPSPAIESCEDLSPALSFASADLGDPRCPIPTFAHVDAIPASDSIQGSYILEVRDARSNELERMIWVERETYLIRKVVAYRGGVRQTTIRVEWLILDQGFGEEDLINVPRGAEIIRG